MVIVFLFQLRVRLDRIERRVAVSCQKSQSSNLVSISTNTSPIKEEIKEENTNNNNNENNISPSNELNYHLSVATKENRVSPHLRSQKPDSPAKSDIISPQSSRILRNSTSSPVLRSNKDDGSSLLKVTSGADYASLRHSPRLDSLNFNYSENNCKNLNKDDLSSSTIKVSKSDHDKSSSKSCSKISIKLPKNTSPKDRKSRSDAFSEVECSNLKSRSQSPADLIKRRQSITVPPKRKSEGECEDEPEIKKSKKNVDNEIVIKTSSLVPAPLVEDKTTNHSLRSREKPRENSGSSIASSDSQQKAESPTLGKKSYSEPLSDAKLEVVSSKEHERVFIRSASEAAAKLKDQNTKCVYYRLLTFLCLQSLFIYIYLLLLDALVEIGLFLLFHINLKC